MFRLSGLHNILSTYRSGALNTSNWALAQDIRVYSRPGLLTPFGCCVNGENYCELADEQKRKHDRHCPTPCSRLASSAGRRPVSPNSGAGIITGGSASLGTPTLELIRTMMVMIRDL